MLDGLPVLDLTDHRGEIGPWMLRELGAEVVKVEPPGGTSARAAHPMHDGTSLQFEVYNSGKQLVELDPSSASDRSTLRRLVARSAIVFDSGPPGLLAAFGIDRRKLMELNPTIVSVLVTAVGSDGPRANEAHTELTVAALGGPVRIQGDAERAPVKVSIPQVWRHAGAEAALAALVAKARGDRLGEAQFVDLSAQAAMTWTMLNAMNAHAVQGRDFERTGATLHLAMTVPLRHRCRDGYVILVPRGPVGGALGPWLVEEGIVDQEWLDEDWATFDHRIIEGQATMFSHQDLIDALGLLCSRFTKQELLDRGLELGATIAPVNTLSDLLAFEQLESRDFWRHLGPSQGTDGDDAEMPRLPGSFVTVDGARLNHHPIPGPTAQAEPAAADREVDRPVRTSGGAAPAALAFDGLKVADFSWIGVGPITANCLADHGATVVRVESANRIDGLRLQPPFTDAESGIDRSGFFGGFNTSKLSIALDLKNEGGLAVAKRLVQWADVVIDSWTPGAMARLGLGPDAVRSLNPNVITVTTSLLGGGGPYSSMAGYGYHAAAISGFFDLVGWADQPPDGPWLAYTDTIGPRFITTALLAALDRRARTGEGCHLEAAQLEVALQFLAPELVHYEVSGQSPQRIGNRAHDAAPEGIYRCAGPDDWVAISVTDDEAWQRFRQALGNPGWAMGAVLDTVGGRMANHDAIDIGIGSWTAERTEDEVEKLLQEVGVAAAKVQRSSDLMADPQYQHRGFYHWLDHGEVGTTPYAGHAYRIAGYGHGPRTAAPMLGQHTFEVLTDLLGYTEDEVADTAATGCLE
jgi:crotonobetainyl-CoA:carnitine CoA-transferase CaiB-like acyl-CoA transferase